MKKEIAVSIANKKLQKSSSFSVTHLLDDLVKTLWKIRTYFSMKYISTAG